MSAPSGKVLYPPFLQDFMGEALDHLTLDSAGTITGGALTTLTRSVGEVINLAYADANPYETAIAYDPDSDLSTIQDKLDDYVGVLGELDEAATWEDMLDVALSHVNELVPSESDADADVAAFTAQQVTNLAQSYNRVSIQFQDTNSVLSTTFPSALAMLEVGHNNVIAKYSSERRLALSAQRSEALLKSIDQMARVLSWRITGSASATQLQNAQSGVTITSKSSQLRQDVQYNMKEVLWDFDILDRGLNEMGKMAAVPAFPEGLTPEQQALSGLMNALQFALPVFLL